MLWRSEELLNSFYWSKPGKYSLHQLHHLQLVDRIFWKIQLEGVPQVDNLHLSENIGLGTYSVREELQKININLLGLVFFCLSFGDFLLHWALSVVFILKGFDRNRIDEIFQVVGNVIFTFGSLFLPFPGFFQLKNILVSLNGDGECLDVSTW